MTYLAPVLEAFFTQRLRQQRDASHNTIVAYRDTFRLLLGFIQRQLGKPPTQVLLADLDASLIADFLDHLQRERNNRVRTRNQRLSALRSFFHYAAQNHVDHLHMIQRVLGIPTKRFDRAVVAFLSRDELDALLKAPDQSTWIGQRDYTLMLLASETGLRVSELIGLRIDDLFLDHSYHVRCTGKGRKERVTPLLRKCRAALKAWLERRGGSPRDPLFISRRKSALSRDAIERLVKKHAAIAQRSCNSLQHKIVTPHVLRHTAAVSLLQAGVDLSTIALWLGHESEQTTHIYLDADLSIKQKALERLTPPNVPIRRYRPDDELLSFLNGL
jgi:integrase/recombinase XerD